MAETSLHQVVVAGGTGLVGRHLVAALTREGVQVRVLSRSPARAALAPGATGWAWQDLAKALEGADAVINLCGEGIADRRWTPARKRLLLASRVGPTERLVQAMGAAPAGPGVLVQGGAVGIYGARDDRPVTEATPPGTGFLADLCRQWETAADPVKAHAVRLVQLRTGVVLARDGGALPRMALPVKCFQGVILGRGQQGLSWIHIDDLVRLLLEAARNPAFQGPVNATAPGPVSNEAFTRALARRLKRPLLPVPAWLTAPALRALFGELAGEMLLAGAFVHPDQAQAAGFVFRFARLEEALADLL